MFLISNGKRKFLSYSVAIAFMLLSCTAAKANEQLVYVQANISERYIHYNEVMSKYGQIWIEYTITSDKIVADSRAERYIIEKANYFYKKDGNNILLGRVDKTGLYDKNGAIIMETPSNIASGFQVAGISSSLVEYNSLAPCLILQSITDSKHYRETEPYAILDFDVHNDTIRLMDMSRFF